jgi:hypothetical protein
LYRRQSHTPERNGRFGSEFLSQNGAKAKVDGKNYSEEEDKNRGKLKANFSAGRLCT